MSLRPGKTLVLNASFQPLTTVPLPRAVRLVLSGRAEVIEESGLILHSEKLSMASPLVIRLLVMAIVPYTRRVPITRRAVLQRDGGVCGYCRKRATTIDHVIPRGQGGLHTWRNVAAACLHCNGKKGNQTPQQAGMPLLIKPFEPEGTRALKVIIGTMDEAWAPYLTAA